MWLDFEGCSVEPKHAGPSDELEITKEGKCKSSSVAKSLGHPYHNSIF